MSRTVQVTCVQCGHTQTCDVETADEREKVVDDEARLAEMRLQRLKSLPTSLPVGGIITPV